MVESAERRRIFRILLSLFGGGKTLGERKYAKKSKHKQ